MSAQRAGGEPVGIVGLGTVGMAAARSLLDAGTRVRGYRRSGAEDLVARGGEAADSVEDVFRDCPTVLLALPRVDALLDVVAAAASAAEESGRSRTLVIDLSALPLDAKTAARRALEAAGMAMMDAPVGGSPGPDSSARFESIFASGARDDYKAAEPTLHTLSERVWYTGEFGSGHAMKLVNLAVVAMHTVAAAEALRLGIGAGFDPDLLIDVLTHSPAASWVIDDRAERMLAGPVGVPRGTIDAMRRVLDGAADLASEIPLDLPLLQTARTRFLEAADRGWDQRDVTTIYALYGEDGRP